MRIITAITRAHSSTPTTDTANPGSRRGLRRRRLGRRRLIVAGAVIATGVLVGTGFTVQNAVATQARVDATMALNATSGLRHEQLGVYRGIAAAKALDNAEDTITAANATLAAANGKVDASGLAASVASLSGYRSIPVDEVVDLTKVTRAEAEKTAAAAAAFDQAQAEAAAAAAAALAAANTPDGARAFAADFAASQYGWGADQFQCLDKLWQKESGWSYTAFNAGSGATGIPQSLPGSKMASAGADWETNAATQIKWGLGYIKGSYGSPCSAWSHSQSMNWY
ncbi:ribosomal protein L12E/L44/L45/RPP1/RPP2 [Agromyces sp. 3263]|uniref:aggregation-promoting factor C-terminal-like domain-containing protein n=1 Tax=Agromyces sp. 3263 TaxID=2817750 RepID=UPI00285895D8|nr:hypothetical protein [Agromyces sp. 3263]MDR6907001.1 ribosomal protein L12E/L44/L45/RPP1/RPP2 [Agromyces sp. 3263]